MTKQEYMTLMNSLSFCCIMKLCEKNLNVMNIAERIERYGHMENPVHFSNKWHVLYVGRMANMFRRAAIMGATKDELADIGNQLMIGIDAMKYRLNYKQAEEDHHISDLEEKYSIEHFMAHDASEFQDPMHIVLSV